MPDLKASRNGKGADCVRRALDAGLLDQARAQALLAKIRQIEAERFDASGPVGGKRQASLDAFEQLMFERDMKKRAVLRQLLDQDRIAKNLNAAQDRLGLDNQTSLYRTIVDSTGSSRLGYRGAVQEARRVRSMAHRKLDKVLFSFRKRVGGFDRDRAGLNDMLNEIFGKPSGNAAAKEMADAWKETAEDLRRMFNALGGAIPKLNSWMLPQVHNFLLVRNVPMEEWRSFIKPKLDRKAMTDFATGKPLDDAQLDALLKDVYEGIRTKGWDERKVDNMVRSSPIAMRHRENRVLHFSDAEGWLAYQQRFGNGDPFQAMMTYVDDMSREIGAMRAMGANPRATIRFLQARAKKLAYTAGNANDINRAESKATQLDTLYSHFIGTANHPVNGRVARGFSSLRQFLTSAHLGSAVISALTDVGFQRITASYNGLSHWKIMQRQLKLMNPASAGDRKLALRLGLIAEEWSQVAATQMRFTGEAVSGEVARRLADGVLRASGLSAWTQAGRWAFGMEFMGLLADSAGTTFEALTPSLRKALDSYNISPDDWDKIRATQIYEPDKGGFLRPDDLVSRTDLNPGEADTLATKLLDMIQSETEFAVPSVSIMGKSQILGDARPGSFAGEFVRSTLMYKNFAITMFYTHLARGASQAGHFNKAVYFAKLLTATTAMGAMAIQLKEIVNGKDPRPMAGDGFPYVSPKFLLASMMQGGGLGLFGDFLFAENDRFGMTRAAAAAGPVPAFIGDALALTVGNANKAMADGKSSFARDAVKFGSRYTPGSSLWYFRYGLQRLIADTAQEAWDENSAKSFKARRVVQGTVYGNDFFGPPGGGVMPERGPDWANALRTFEEGKFAASVRRKGEDPTDPRFRNIHSVDDYRRSEKLEKLDRRFREKEHKASEKRRHRKKLTPAEEESRAAEKKRKLDRSFRIKEHRTGQKRKRVAKRPGDVMRIPGN